MATPILSAQFWSNGKKDSSCTSWVTRPACAEQLMAAITFPFAFRIGTAIERSPSSNC